MANKQVAREELEKRVKEQNRIHEFVVSKEQQLIEELVIINEFFSTEQAKLRKENEQIPRLKKEIFYLQEENMRLRARQERDLSELAGEHNTLDTKLRRSFTSQG